MKTTWKKFLSLVLAVSVLSTLLVPAMAAGEGEPEQVRNAVLYQINGDGELEYNVTHKAMIADNVAITGDAAITTPDDLKSALGTADHGAAVLGTDIGTRTLGEKAYYADLTLTGGVITGIAITDAVERPIIGISWKKDEVGQDYQGFAEAYERNGAYAVFLPQVTDAQGARNVLASLDGIFMTGGEDWGTELYGEEVTPHGASGVNEARDTSDIAYMQQAVKMGVPLFAVCRGAQGFNVAMGGKLIQDIPYYFGQKLLNKELDPALVTGVATGKIPEDLEGYELLPDEVKSASVEDQDHPDDPHLRIYVDGNIHGGMDSTGYHALKGGILNNSVAIDPESRLAEILGKPELDNVATAHHQAIDPENLGDDLKVVAQASDGIVEGIEYTGTDENGEETFALAVQWHPERDALKDTRDVDVDQDECNALLRALVTEAQ